VGKLTGQALVYHALGRKHDSNAALARLIAKYDTKAAFQVAQAYAFRGECDKSFEWLEHAYKERDAGLPEMKADPLLKGLRQDPRYADLLKKLRLLIDISDCAFCFGRIGPLQRFRKQCTKLCACPSQPRHHGSERTVQHARNLLIRQIFIFP
jgi:hypothetical protein